MIFTDTHTHLYDEQFAGDRAAILQRALDAGVEKMYMPNCDSSTVPGMLDLEARWPGHCFPMMGLHPVYVRDNYRDELEAVRAWLERRPFFAIGEIGIDKYWDLAFLDQQKDAFALQIDWALSYDLPIVIHSREATQDCIDIVRSRQNGSLRGIFHCFGGSREEAEQITALGLSLGIGGVLTFKKSGLDEVLKDIDLKHIVLETDAPYLAPVPYRGKRNESSYIPLIAEKLAMVKGLSLAEIAEITTANAEKIFRNSMK